MEPDLIKNQSQEIRKLILSTIVKAKGGHLGRPFRKSIFLATLYFHVLRFPPKPFRIL